MFGSTLAQMFSPEDRAYLTDRLVAAAEADTGITAAAVVGSAADHRQDRWSDIDLAFRLASAEQPVEVAESWTTQMYAEHQAVDHLDVWSGDVLFRVFFLADSLQVDLSFWPAKTFAATGPSFRLLFGDTGEPTLPPLPDPRGLIGWGWLYALHARSAIARRRPLQAVQMLNGLRDQVISLACLRHGVPAGQGRGVDDLPGDVTAAVAATLVAGGRPADLEGSLERLADLLIDEIKYIDRGLAGRLDAPITELVRSVLDRGPAQ